MSPTRNKIAVFDLDGTLADTAGDLIGTLNVILEREGLAALPLEPPGRRWRRSGSSGSSRTFWTITART